MWHILWHILTTTETDIDIADIRYRNYGKDTDFSEKAGPAMHSSVWHILWHSVAYSDNNRDRARRLELKSGLHDVVFLRFPSTYTWLLFTCLVVAKR